MKAEALTRVRKICLAFPDVFEKEAWRAPTFRVRGGRMFAMFVEDHHGDGRLAVWCDAPPGTQAEMVAGDPVSFYVPAYVGKSGWVGVRLDRGLNWDIVAAVLRQAYLGATPRPAPHRAAGRRTGARKSERAAA